MARVRNAISKDDVAEEFISLFDTVIKAATMSTLEEAMEALASSNVARAHPELLQYLKKEWYRYPPPAKEPAGEEDEAIADSG